MFKNIIARRPCPSVTEGISTAGLGKPDYELALKQHDAYLAALKKCGVEITLLEANNEFPDSCFVEDVALCTKNCAIITRPGAQSRRGEAMLPDMKDAIEKFFRNIEVTDPHSVLFRRIGKIKHHFQLFFDKQL